MTKERHLAGNLQHPDEARNGGELMAVATDLDDVHWLDTQDKFELRDFLDKALVLIGASRQVRCSWLNVACRLRNRRAMAPLKGD
jgi:hypothetical protein